MARVSSRRRRRRRRRMKSRRKRRRMWKDHTTPQPTHCTPVLLQLSTTAYVIDFNGQRLNLKFAVEPLPNALRCTEMSGCEWRLQAPHARQTPLNAFNTRRARCRRCQRGAESCVTMRVLIQCNTHTLQNNIRLRIFECK